MCVAELLALVALENGHAAPDTHGWVLAALLAGVVVVMLGVLQKSWPGAQPEG